MSSKEQGASPLATGPSQVEPVPVSPLRASVPSAGDIVIIEHPYVYDRHTTVRVVNTGKIMWTVNYRDRFGDSGWTSDLKRKVINWLPAPENMTPAEIDEFLQQAADELRVAERVARDAYAARIKAFTEGRAA